MSVTKIVRNSMVFGMIKDEVKVFFCGSPLDCYQYCVKNDWQASVGQGRGRKPLTVNLSIKSNSLY